MENDGVLRAKQETPRQNSKGKLLEGNRLRRRARAAPHDRLEDLELVRMAPSQLGKTDVDRNHWRERMTPGESRGQTGEKGSRVPEGPEPRTRPGVYPWLSDSQEPGIPGFPLSSGSHLSIPEVCYGTPRGSVQSKTV